MHLLRATALLGIAVLIAKLFATGQMVLYMSPSLDPLTLGTGVVSACLGIWELRAAFHRPGPIGGSSVDNALTVGLVLLPVALGLLITPRALDSSALGGEDLSRLVLVYPSQPGSQMARVLAAGEEPPELFAFLRRAGAQGIGQQVRVAGLVARGDSLVAGEFMLLRYSVVHCVADARPIGVLVLADASPWHTDEWVEIDGSLDLRQQNGDHLVTVRASTIRPIREPPNPYLPPM